MLKIVTVWLIDRVTEWPSDQVTKGPSDWVTEWPSDQVTKWPSDQVTKWPSDQEWPSDWVTEWQEASQTIDRMVYFQIEPFPKKGFMLHFDPCLKSFGSVQIFFSIPKYKNFKFIIHINI